MPKAIPIVTWLLGRGRSPVLVGLAVITVLMSVSATRLEVEQDTRSMVSQQPGQAEVYDRFRDLFGNDENLLLSVTLHGLLDPAGLAYLDELTTRVAAFEGVRHVLSLSNARQLVAGRYGAEEIPLLPRSVRMRNDPEAIEMVLRRNPRYLGLLISADRRTAGLVIEPADERNDVLQRRKLIGAIRDLMAEQAGQAEFHLTGVGVQKIDVADYIQRDQRIVLPLVVIILMLLLAVIFRRPSGVIVPLLATLVSLIWTMGLYALCGYQLNTITALLPPVVMVLAISNSIHLYNGWLHLGNAEQGLNFALAAKVTELATPCLFTALTTAFGLVSLTISTVPAVRHFALFAAAGVMLSLLVSMLLVPVSLSFLPMPARHIRRGTGLLRRTLQATADLTVTFPRAIMLVSVVLVMIALFGIPRLQNNTDMVGFLHADAPLAIDTSFIDNHLSGVNALEFMVSRVDGRPLDEPGDYAKVAAFEEVAGQEPAVANVFSILSLLQQIHRAETGGEILRLPEDRDILRYELDLLSMASDTSIQRRFLTTDRTTARISIWLHDVGSRKAANVVNAIEERGRVLFGAEYRLVPTGSFYQMTQDSNRLVTDMVKSFSLSMALVFLSILVLVRSLRLALLAMIPNLIPIAWTFGLMGYLGIDLSTGTAMIGAVVIGLAVDDTIHYLVHYKRVCTGNIARAVVATTTRVGRALVIASLVLAFGFWAGCLGSFKPTVYFSLLVGCTMLGALLCDLLVLPACLVVGFGGRKAVA